MASTELYPPIVDSYTAAFTIDKGICRVYYSLSRFSSISIKDIQSIHFSIVKQDTGINVINPNDDKDNGRYRGAGLLVINTNGENSGIINEVANYDNLYYTDILASDIRDEWTEGWVYKIQVRLGKVAYEGISNQENQVGSVSTLAAWLNQNANKFSEWSTYTITKAIAEPVINIPLFKYNSNENIKIDEALNISTLELNGYYNNSDPSEILYSYRLTLYNNVNDLLEDSKLIYANQYVPNQFYYLFKQELDNGAYTLILEYETLNKYTKVLKFDFKISSQQSDNSNIKLLSAEDGALMQNYTSIEAEQTDGRIGLKLYSEKENDTYSGNIYIRRSDMTTNFSKWEDIKVLFLSGESINDYPIVYDYTAESGVWYNYGIQTADENGVRSPLVEINSPIKREFDYSYLLGENGQQLKLAFDNAMGNFKTMYSESKIDTIGGKFPFIVRNGNMKYRTFPVSGLISFNMDENNLFTSQEDIYKYEKVIALYKDEKLKNALYNYTYERDFRKKVMEFLEDGKPKLFKSPTEGNIIVRLMEIDSTPNSTLSRMIYSFSSNATEVAEPTVENYKKYNFLF